jgi:Xaa-Pro aminopeptidase
MPSRPLSCTTVLHSVLLALLTPFTLAAQSAPPAPTIAPEEYAARRDSLAVRLGDGVVLAFGAVAPRGEERPHQLPAFRWLTGFLEPDAALVLIVHGGRARGILFTQPRDPRRALYDGFPPDSAAVARATGMGVRTIAALGPTLDSLLGRRTTLFTLRDYAGNDYAESDSLSRGAAFVRTVSSSHPGLEVRDAHPVTDSLRARKSPAELGLLRRAIDVTVAAQREAMATVHPGMWEYQIDALFDAASGGPGGTDRRSARSSARAPTPRSTTTRATIGRCGPVTWWSWMWARAGGVTRPM